MMLTKEERKWQNDVIATTDKVVQIRPHIHKIVLSGGWSENCPLLERAKWFETGGKNYQKKAYIKNEHGTFTILSHPQKHGYPDLLISTIGTNPSGLIWLGKIMPRLKISSVELAIDFMCEDSKAVSDVFCMLLHYIYFPRFIHKVKMIGGDFSGRDYTHSENRVFKAFNKSNNKTGKPTNDVKIYERGPDKLKQKKNNRKYFWHAQNTDRVRLEVRLKRRGGNSKLKTFNIHKLKSFISYRKIDTLFPTLFRFACFTGKGFFQEHEEYYDQKLKRIMSFQEMYINAIKDNRKPASRISNAKHTKPLERKIVQALREFTDDLTRQANEHWGTPRSHRSRIVDLI